MLYLTYDNTKHTDGAGAQIQRILSIYMIAKYYNIGYIHTPLYQLDYQGLKCLEENKPDILQIDMYNDLFKLEGTANALIDETHEVSSITDNILMKYKNADKNTLLKITYGDGLIDSNTSIFNESPKLNWISNIPSTPLNVAIHIRRGELYVVESNRMLPNSYYINCMKSLKTLLDTNNIPFVFHIYTEVPTKSINITPSHHGIMNRIKQPVTIKPEDNHLEEFKCFESINYHINESPVNALIDLTNSDILLASRSSFSYVAAILKKKGVVLFHPFWHCLSKSWIPVSSASDIINKKDLILSKLK